MTRDPFDTALATARALHAQVPELRNFASWPTDLTSAGLAPRSIPATDLVADLVAPTLPLCRPLLDATRALAAHAHWKRTYTEAEVGADFRARYGYFELFGPAGHFHSASLRGYLGFWGAGLHYDWHHHQAEEIYFILAGSAEFHAENQPPVTIGPGQIRQHTAHQPHAMTTHDNPVLTFVLWRGTGLSGLPEMAGEHTL